MDILACYNTKERSEDEQVPFPSTTPCHAHRVARVSEFVLSQGGFFVEVAMHAAILLRGAILMGHRGSPTSHSAVEVLLGKAEE
eukprot:325279-Amorphochlora_amoeboformis.AAC.1